MSTMPYWLTPIISSIKGQKQMKVVSNWKAVFENIGERGDPTESNNIVRTKITDKENGFA